MPATPARIGFIQTDLRRVTSLTTTAKARHGNLARESEDPIETFFDNVADAQVMADARQALLSPERQRFMVTLNSAAEIQALSYVSAIPVGRFVDTDRGVNKPVLMSDFTIDYNRLAAAVRIWG